MEIVAEVVPKARVGFGVGAGKDDSDNLDDMNYAERLVMNEEFLKALGTLQPISEVTKQIDGKDTKVKVGGFLRLSKGDILKVREGETIEMNGVAHKVNQVFVALEIPFYAQSYATDDAEKVEHTATRGKKAGKTYTKVLADRLQIYRTGETFDINNYAASASKRVIEDGVNDYNEPTEGMRLREDKWIDENGENLTDVLEKVGISLEIQE